MFSHNILVTTLCAAAMMLAAAPLAAQSLASRAMTEEPTCRTVENAYELCLVGDAIVAKSGVIFSGLHDGMATFGGGSGIIAQAIHLSKDSGVSALEHYDVRPADPTIPIVQLGPLGEYDYGAFTFSAPIAQLPAASPYIVSLLDLGDYDVLVISSFPNKFGLPERAVLTDAQRRDHEDMLTAFHPLKGAS